MVKFMEAKSFTEFPGNFRSSEVDVENEQSLVFISGVSWIWLVAVTIFLSVLRDFLGLASMGGTVWAASWVWNFLRDSSKFLLLRLGGWSCFASKKCC